MGPSNCAVVGCRNNSYQLKLWKKKLCEVHDKVLKGECGCWPSYRLFCFPSNNRYLEQRDRWARNMKRMEKNKSTWIPKPSDRVCSDHFLDEEPTEKNPDPTLQLGYEKPSSKPRRTLFREPAIKKRKKGKVARDEESSMTSSPTQSVALPEGPNSPGSAVEACTAEVCSCCKQKDESIDLLGEKIEALTIENLKLEKEKKRKHVFSWKKIKTDDKMNLYTGLSSILTFLTLFKMIEPYLAKTRYWRGPKRVLLKNHKALVRSSLKKLSYEDEFLLTLMRLRLGLLNEDLADRFGISTTVCSNTFKTWIRILRILLGNSLVQWLPVEAIHDHLPSAFQKRHPNLRCIIDCTEIFIERAKNLEVQAQTWSDYKSHNTIKFLIGISPTGYITFLSDCYSGRASDKFICSDSGFYDLLEFNDEIMADRGFQIREELMLRYCSLSVPPGARIKSQMTSKECKKTKDVANLRIHVERAIKRIKTYIIFKSVLPITMLHHADDIVKTCAALCNLKPLLIRTKENKNKS